LKIQYGGRPPFYKWFYRYISAADHPISMKLGVPDANFDSKNGHVTSIKILQTQNGEWRTAAILKIVFGYISTSYCPINAKFGMKKHNHFQTQVT